jgi:hypothetical protein
MESRSDAEEEYTEFDDEEQEYQEVDEIPRDSYLLLASWLISFLRVLMGYAARFIRH